MNFKLSILLLFIGSSTLFAQNWLTNFEEAKSISDKENKHILLVFQGSDWCAPCIKLDREIWSTLEFVKYANDHFILVKADFPRKNKNKLSESQQRQNSQLMEKYNVQGYFPFVAIIDKNGKMLGNTGYIKSSVFEYIKTLTSFN